MVKGSLDFPEAAVLHLVFKKSINCFFFFLHLIEIASKGGFPKEVTLTEGIEQVSVEMKLPLLGAGEV